MRTIRCTLGKLAWKRRGTSGRTYVEIAGAAPTSSSPTRPSRRPRSTRVHSRAIAANAARAGGTHGPPRSGAFRARCGRRGDPRLAFQLLDPGRQRGLGDVPGRRRPPRPSAARRRSGTPRSARAASAEILAWFYRTSRGSICHIGVQRAGCWSLYPSEGMHDMNATATKDAIEDRRDWAEADRWNRINRDHARGRDPPAHGSLRIEHSLARHGAEKLCGLLAEEDYVAALGLSRRPGRADGQGRPEGDLPLRLAGRGRRQPRRRLTRPEPVPGEQRPPDRAADQQRAAARRPDRMVRRQRPTPSTTCCRSSPTRRPGSVGRSTPSSS